MKSQPVSMSMLEMRANLADTLNHVAFLGIQVVITRHRKAVAALVSINDFTLLNELRRSTRKPTAKRPRTKVRRRSSKK